MRTIFCTVATYLFVTLVDPSYTIADTFEIVTKVLS